LARREFLAVLVEDVRKNGSTAVLSSHIVTDVQQACDTLIVLTGGRVALHASVAEARATHRSLAAGAADGRPVLATFPGADGQPIALLASDDPSLPEASLEDIVLGHLAAARRAPGEAAA
jgi:ABC-2 type transport system ATP-binding protein